MFTHVGIFRQFASSKYFLGLKSLRSQLLPPAYSVSHNELLHVQLLWSLFGDCYSSASSVAKRHTQESVHVLFNLMFIDSIN